jgi:hypothetical protein
LGEGAPTVRLAPVVPWAKTGPVCTRLVTCSSFPLASRHMVHTCQCGTPHILCEIAMNKQEVTHEYEEVPRHRERPRKEFYIG